jgi:hypothetical protein
MYMCVSVFLPTKLYVRFSGHFNTHVYSTLISSRGEQGLGSQY